jgi:hypothetical protein
MPSALLVAALSSFVACAAATDSPPERRVAVHGFVWNGSAPGTLNDHGPLTIYLFEQPGSCDALPPLLGASPARGPDGLRIEAEPVTWTAGERIERVTPTFVGPRGEEAAFVTHPGALPAPIELVTAPKTKGSVAHAIVSARFEIARRDVSGMLVTERVDIVDAELDLEVCGDIDWPPKLLR